MPRMRRLLPTLAVAAAAVSRCSGFGYYTIPQQTISVPIRLPDRVTAQTYSFRLSATRRWHELEQIILVNLDDPNERGPSLVAACDFSDTFGPEDERLTIDGIRILYRNGRIDGTTGQWQPHEGRPIPHLFDTLDLSPTDEGDMVIDKNGFPWRAEHVLKDKGLRRSNMEATRQLWRPLDELERINSTTTTTEETLALNETKMPIPWFGPFNIPTAEKGLGFNRKLRDDMQFGCELDDERWIVYYTKLATFTSTYGHANVPLDWAEDESLGRWVFKQRVLYRRYARNNYYQHEILEGGRFGRKVNPLSPWRIQMLYDIGFEFKINLRWQDRFGQLRKYKEKYGHVRVPCSVNGQDEEFPGLYMWIQLQRTEYRRFRHGIPSFMTKSRAMALSALGLDWDPMASMWKRRIKQLAKFRTKHGTSRVRKTQDFELATWLTHQRTQYRIYQETPWDSTLTTDKIEELEALGVDWEPLENRWQDQYQALRAFKSRVGHCTVPVDYPDNPSLSLWVQKQRQYYKDGSLSEEHEQQLTKLGFVFELYEECFARGMEKLKAYKEQHGDCRVPRSYPDTELVSFVVQQRNQYRQRKIGQTSSLTENRIQQLEALGFDWSVQANIWDENFDRLREFHDEFGHCNVPGDYEDQTLHHFVAVQRAQYKRLQAGESQRLTPERQTRLEAIGFAWNANDTRWMERYAELMSFNETHGHCNVPDRYSINPQLGSWVRNQRTQYRNLLGNKKSTMTPSRIGMLEKIGFQWSVRKAKSEVE